MDPHCTLWSILVREPGLGVIVLDAEGTVIEANRRGCTLLFCVESAAPSASALADRMPEGCAAEWIALASRVIASGAPIVYRFVRKGMQLQATLWPWACDAHPGVLVLVREGQVDPGAAFEIRESSSIDLGPLDVLTSRELEVLALIGTGCTTATMAARLERSPRTIEKHRDSIAAKLGTRTRVELARVAGMAGLELGDAQLTRTR